MENIVSYEKCTGCGACANICPKHAVSMKINNEGFLYPKIDSKKCIDCGLCKKTCPVLNGTENKALNTCYAGYNKNEDELLTSSSGGIFPLIAKYVLDNNGIVIGAAFDKANKLKHIAITKMTELNLLKGSKYLQSEIGKIYTYVKNNVKKVKILFVGTPCQVAGLKFFLREDYENLFCIDLFCHGVPSQKLFSKFINEIENEFNDNILDYNFRDKTSGWETYSNTILLRKTKHTELQKDNNYMKLFLSDIALRESCYNCSFKLGNKYSDITLGDFWGVKNECPDMYNNNGVSAIIINSEKGKELFSKLEKGIFYKSCNIKSIINGNPLLERSVSRPPSRETFYKNIDKYTIKGLVKKYVPKKSIIKRVLSRIKRILIKK